MDVQQGGDGPGGWGGVMQMGGKWVTLIGGGGRATLSKIKNETQNLPPSTDTDDWVVMEELRRRRRQIIMQQ